MHFFSLIDARLRDRVFSWCISVISSMKTLDRERLIDDGIVTMIDGFELTRDDERAGDTRRRGRGSDGRCVGVETTAVEPWPGRAGAMGDAGDAGNGVNGRMRDAHSVEGGKVSEALTPTPRAVTGVEAKSSSPTEGLMTPETRALGETLDALDGEAELTVESFLRARFDAATTTSATDVDSRSDGTRRPGGESTCGDDEEAAAAAAALGSSSLYEADTDLEFAEEVDPRVGDALEELNESMSECNALENDLNAARRERTRTQKEARERLAAVSKKLSSSVLDAVPYFHKRALAQMYQARSIEALRAYEAAHDAHERAKQRNDELERDLLASSGRVDVELMEACADAARDIAETAAVKERALGVHASNTRRAVQATTEATGLEKERRGAVKKAAPYFSAKTIGEDACAAADARVADLKLSVRQAKARYDAALRSLNEISEEVHARREAAKLDRERRLADDDAG